MNSPCYICGADCLTPTDGEWLGCCRDCAIKVREVHEVGSGIYNYGSNSDPREGDGFSNNPRYHWHNIVMKLKLEKIGQSKAYSMGVKKVYTDVCPCGIHPSQCDYHRS